jgi:hypothetical protein
MKQIIFIIFLLLSIGCSSQTIVKRVFDKTYARNQYEIAYNDIYNQLKYYKIDSIPLNEWITNEMISDTINVTQKIISKYSKDNSVYTFIFTKYTYPKSSFYEFYIRYSEKK